MHSSGIFVILFAVNSVIYAIPTSLVADLKSGNFVPKNKASSRNIQELVSDNGVLNTNHIAIKRGGNNKFHNDPSMLPRLSNFLYKNYNTADDDTDASGKTLKDYEKAFQYGSSRDRLEQEVENAILKSEMYGVPAQSNYYRGYYDDNSLRNNRLTSNGYRNKRDTKLTSEEIIRLLAMLENKFQRNPNSWDNLEDGANGFYRRYQDNRQQLQQRQQRLPAAWYQQARADSNNSDDTDDEDEDEQWLQEAVPYPHEVEMNDIGADYAYPARQNKRNLYGFANNFGTHFRQSPNQKRTNNNNNDYYNYYISELMRTQPEPTMTVKKRAVL